MKHKTILLQKIVPVVMAAALIVSAPLTAPSFTAQAKTTETKEEQEKIEVTEISSLDEFTAFVENCQYDYWSVGKVFKLTTDLDLSGTNFDGIASFGGVLYGNNHTISGLKSNGIGSNTGLFRYIAQTGMVCNLKVSGKIAPTGSAENVGGIAGVNYGTISYCSFEGNIVGQTNVGGIAGINKATGVITGCTSSGKILATNGTGGIAGENLGVIEKSTNESEINTEEMESTLDLGGVDISSLNLTQNVVTRNDMGGIAGISKGTISNCTNNGTIGFSHSGYNVGGIAGRQSGIILSCQNNGAVCGRKDVGGIVGQAEPYIESVYLSDKVDEAKDNINQLNNTINQMGKTVSDTSAESKVYAQNLSKQYENSLKNVNLNADDIKNAVNSDDEESKAAADNISSAMDHLSGLDTSNPDDAEAAKKDIETINNNLQTIQNNSTVASDAESVSDELSANENVNGLIDSVDSGIQSLNKSLTSLSNQITNMTNAVETELSVISGGTAFIEDVSSIDAAENTDGVISECTNYGEIRGDLNAGGIAGTMNIEYEADPELDVDFTKSTNITLRSTVNDVLMHSINYGAVIAKRNCAGGIVGLMEIGLSYATEGYGSVSSDGGDYVGGIVGQSATSVYNCYSLCNVSGGDYIGGIAGLGYTISDSVTMPSITSDGECLGSIAGYANEEGTLSGNVFVGKNLDAVDNINYAGKADKITYEELMDREDIPEGFHTVNVTFETEDEVLSIVSVAYGGSLSENDMPEIPEKEGFYTRWSQDNQSLNNITGNITLTAEYVPWTTAIASSEHSESNMPYLLVLGEFYSDASLNLEEFDLPDSDGEVLYAYSWTIDEGSELAQDIELEEAYEARFYAPEEKGTTTVWLEESGKWKQEKAERDGSYLICTIPYSASFAIIHKPADYTIPIIIGVAVFLVVLALLLHRVQKRAKQHKEKRKEKKQSKQTEKKE